MHLTWTVHFLIFLQKVTILIITGYGFGHGLGLSQWGAEAMAEKNGDGKEYYKRILLHYFTGSKIEKIY